MTDNGQTECALECSLACLLQIDCAQDPSKRTHATSEGNHQKRVRPQRCLAPECKPQSVMCDGPDTSAQSLAIWSVVQSVDLRGIAATSPHDRAALLSSRTPRSQSHESSNARDERSLPPVASLCAARTARPSSTLNCPALPTGDRKASDLYQCRHWELVRPLRNDANEPRSPARTRGPSLARQLSFREAPGAKTSVSLLWIAALRFFGIHLPSCVRASV